MLLRKILAIKLRSLGDTVLMSAPLIELRKAYPHAEIHLACTAAWAPLFESHPAVDRIWTYERRKEATARAKAVMRVAFSLRKENFDCAINFHASPSSAMIAFATGARIRSVHFHGHKDQNKYSTVTIPGKGIVKPVIERDMDALRALDLKIPEGRLTKIYLQPKEIEESQDQLKQLLITPPILAIGLGASRPSKKWPLENFAQLAIKWCSTTNGSVVALTGLNEDQDATTFLKYIESNQQVRSKTTLLTAKPIRQIAGILSQCAVFVGNDSGPMHLAVAVSTPTVTIFGPEDPFEWHPYPQEHHPYFFKDQLTCRRDAMPGMPPWCGLNKCIDEKHQCMELINTEEVFTKIKQVARL